jgi:hypothetical protein
VSLIPVSSSVAPLMVSLSLLIITSHVDDLSLFAETLKAITVFKSQFKKHVNFTYRGDITQLLGIVVTHDCCPDYLFLSQALH